MRGFDADERETIREALVDAGESRFLREGPDRTTVEDLTDDVGIAKGSFYSFFDSKGDLFLEVFVRLRDDLLDSVIEAVEDVDDGREGIETLFRTYVEWLEAHPIVQRIAADHDRGRFRRTLPAEKLAEAEREGVERLVPVVRRWQDNGSLRGDLPAADVVGLVEPVALLAVTNDEYDEAYRRQRDALIETIARGLAP